MEITSNLLLSAGSGLLAGGIVGFILKKIVKIAAKIAIAIGILWVASLMYLQHIRVISIDENALDNLMQTGYDTLNNTIGTMDCIDMNSCISQVPMFDTLQNVGLPLTSGFGAGLLIGWIKG